jgi:hypothetical protein
VITQFAVALDLSPNTNKHLSPNTNKQVLNVLKMGATPDSLYTLFLSSRVMADKPTNYYANITPYFIIMKFQQARSLNIRSLQSSKVSPNFGFF